MTDLRGFSRKMRAMAKELPERADQLVRTVALSVQSLVVMATPVDTGQARANWQVNLDSAATGTQPAPPTPGVAVSQAIAAGQQVISKYKGGRAEAAIHITNNLPYIVRLDNGWSKQAPIGYVHAAAQTAADAVHGAKLTGA